MTISRNIYQFWDRFPPPAEITRLTTTWRHNHSGFGYFLYDDYAAADLIRRNFDKSVLEAFLVSKLPTMRADLFRYAVLFLYGGIYVDADNASLSSLESFVDLSSDLVVCRRTPRATGVRDCSPLSRYFAIRSDFIAAKPGLAALENAIAQAAKNVRERKSNSPWQVTGPGVLEEQTRRFYHERSKQLSILDADCYERFMRIAAGNLDYRKGGRHWSKVMERESIFYETISKSHLSTVKSRGLRSIGRVFANVVRCRL